MKIRKEEKLKKMCAKGNKPNMKKQRNKERNREKKRKK